jgi:hypothetical protein
VHAASVIGMAACWPGAVNCTVCAGLLIPGAQRAAAEPVVPPGRRPAAGVDGMQRGQEPGQVSGIAGQIGDLA